MTWFKVDDGFHDHPKVAELAPSEWGNAVALWLVCGAWCARHLTDGVIPLHTVQRLTPLGRKATKTAIDALVRVRLWVLEGDRAVFHEWSAWQPSKQAVEHRRAKTAERVANSRNRKTSDKDASCNAVTSSVTNADCNAAPDPTRPDQCIYTGGDDGSEVASTPPICFGVLRHFRQRFETHMGLPWSGPKDRDYAGLEAWIVAMAKSRSRTPEEVSEALVDDAFCDPWFIEQRCPFGHLQRNPEKIWGARRRSESSREHVA